MSVSTVGSCNHVGCIVGSVVGGDVSSVIGEVVSGFAGSRVIHVGNPVGRHVGRLAGGVVGVFIESMVVDVPVTIQKLTVALHYVVGHVKAYSQCLYHCCMFGENNTLKITQITYQCTSLASPTDIASC